MKKIRSFALLLALISLSSGAFAQSAGDVLERARERYRRDLESRIGPALADRVPWTPFLFSFTPMVSVPFGYYDASIGVGLIGSLKRDVFGFDTSSVFNLSRDVRGFQCAGVFDIAGDVFGGQAAGVFNFASSVRGGQASGVFNIANELSGVQAAAVFNIAADTKGVQAAGVFNIAGDLDGVQMAGVANIAHNAKGLQVGLVNIANEMDGIQLGLVNIARDGVGGFGIAVEPAMGHVELWWQNGTRLLYTVVTAEQPMNGFFSGVDHLIMGAGIGTRIGGRYYMPYLDIEAIAASQSGTVLAKIPAFLVGGDWTVFASASYFPELRLKLGIPLMRGRLTLIGGVMVDIGAAGFCSVPAELCSPWSAQANVFGIDMTAYGRWFVGIKI